MRGPFLGEYFNDWHNLGSIDPRFFKVGHLNEICPFRLQLLFCLLIFVRYPEMIILLIKLGQVGHLFKMPAPGTNQGYIYSFFVHHRFLSTLLLSPRHYPLQDHRMLAVARISTTFLA
jgi:hypothetical protein